jgi:hypothetical protein
MIHSKKQILRSMQSYEVGGSSDDACMEEYMDDKGKKRRRRKKNCGKTKTSRVWSPKEKAGLAGKIIGGAGAVIGGIAANNKYGVISKVKEKLGLKNGGAIKTVTKKKK